MDRRSFMAGCAGLPFLAGHARAQSGPLTRIIFPFAAGGSGDLLTRLVAEHLRPALDRSVIVENRTGARRPDRDQIGDERRRRTATTILITTGPTMYLLPMVEEKPSFDHAKDFVPVSLLGRFEFGMSTGAGNGRKGFRAARRLAQGQSGESPRSACRATAPSRISPGRGSSRRSASR